MSQTFLEMTYRKGRPLAAYLYLPRQPNDRSVRTVGGGSGLKADYAADGRLIGIEITSPTLVTVESLNAVLSAAQLPPLSERDIAPLIATQQTATATKTVTSTF